MASIAIISLWVASIMACAYLASGKNRGIGYWIWMAVILGPIAVIILLALPIAVDEAYQPTPQSGPLYDATQVRDLVTGHVRQLDGANKVEVIRGNVEYRGDGQWEYGNWVFNERSGEIRPK